jgi:hypothetical protein
MHNNGHISKCITATGNIKAKFKVNQNLKNLAPGRGNRYRKRELSHQTGERWKFQARHYNTFLSKILNTLCRVTYSAI